jgi:hypothetical protein
MNLIQKLVILCLLLQGGIAYALDGWKISIDDDSYAYVPTDLKRGKIFMYLASGPYILNGAEMKGWFENQALKIQNKIGKPQNAWVVKPDKTNWSISNYFIEPKSGKQLSVASPGGGPGGWDSLHYDDDRQSGCLTDDEIWLSIQSSAGRCETKNVKHYSARQKTKKYS